MTAINVSTISISQSSLEPNPWQAARMSRQTVSRVSHGASVGPCCLLRTMVQDASNKSSNDPKRELYNLRTRLNFRDGKGHLRRLLRSEVSRARQKSFGCARTNHYPSKRKPVINRLLHDNTTAKQQVLLTLRFKQSWTEQQAQSTDRVELSRNQRMEPTDVSLDAKVENVLTAMQPKLREQSRLIQHLTKLERRLDKVMETTDYLKTSQLRRLSTINGVRTEILRHEFKINKADTNY